MSPMGTQSMGRNRGTSQDRSAGGDWAGGNQEVSLLSETNEAVLKFSPGVGEWYESKQISPYSHRVSIARELVSSVASYE